MSDERNAWGYVRLSQRGRDGSLEEQKKNIREYVRRNDRLELSTTLNEGDSTSGFNSDREKYTLLVNKLRNDDLGAIVVRDRARLSRDFDERLRLITDFRTADTELHVIEAGGYIDMSDVQTASMECIHAAMDHMKKMIEIQRSREAMKQRQEQGYDHGRPPFGFQYDDDGQYWVPGENFDDALEILDRRDRGETYSEIEETTGVPIATVSRILDRREMYENQASNA